MSNTSSANIIKMIRGLIKDLAKTNEGDVFIFDTDSSFSLSADYVFADSIKVYVGKTEISSFTYDEDTNKVTISSTLNKNDVILIKYSYYEKYSDSEIVEYIRASLPHFVMNRYKKTFFLNDSDEVVNANGLNLTLEEAQMVALVTAIEIDPKNVTVRLPDFTISAQEDMSKTEQIANLFSKWTRSFGVIDFLEEE